MPEYEFEKYESKHIATKCPYRITMCDLGLQGEFPPDEVALVGSMACELHCKHFISRDSHTRIVTCELDSDELTEDIQEEFDQLAIQLTDLRARFVGLTSRYKTDKAKNND